MNAHLKTFALFALLNAVSSEAAVYQLIPIGTTGTTSGISNNGWVAGTTAGNKAYIWSQQSAGILKIGDLPGGADYSVAYDVNSAGQVVGASTTDVGNHAFIWDAVTGMQDIGGIAGSSSSYASGINEQGHVAITSSSAAGFSVTLWSPDGTLRNIGDLPGGGNDVFSYAINDQDQIAGVTSLNGVITAYIWDPVDGMTSLGDLPTGSDVSYAFALNNASQVAGRGNTTEGDRAFLWSGATGMVNLGTMPGGYGSYAYGLNNLGQVVGHFTLVGQHRAFLWTAESGMTDLNLLADAEAAGWLLLEAYDINDSGWIVGLGVNPSDASQGYLLIPVTPPVLGDIAPAGAPDGQLNIADLMRLMRMVEQLEVPSSQDALRADINGDSILDVRDALLMRGMLGVM